MPETDQRRPCSSVPVSDQPDGTGPELSWDASGTPIAERFGDPYYSRHDGRAETRHVFLGGNALPARWKNADTFTIAELGFGTGLNFFETLASWRSADRPASARLVFVSFERYPLKTDDLVRAISAWPELADDCAELARRWPPNGSRATYAFGDACLEIHIGDANAEVLRWGGDADAWFLDGFSPAKNPDMWGAELMRTVAERTAPGGTFATFTAAGWVRRNLVSAGFAVEKWPGYGRKRECLRGVKSPPVTSHR